MGTWLSIILGVSVRVFPDEINFESDWLRQIATSQCEWTSSKLLKAWIEQKGWIRENLVTPPIFELEYQFSPVFWLRLKLRLFALLLLRPLDSTLKVNYHFSCVSSLFFTIWATRQGSPGNSYVWDVSSHAYLFNHLCLLCLLAQTQEYLFHTLAYNLLLL